MVEKIKGNNNFQLFIWLFVIGLLVYSRFINLGWSLPYPMHPDERNMAISIQQLSCKFPINNFLNCFNPHFFAYGQFPLYLGYVIVWLMKFFDGDLGWPIGFQEAVISLRFISAVASIISIFVLIKIVFLISNLKSKSQNWLIFLVLTFSPYAIQFAHFGTTESLLMLFYSLIIYYCLKILDSKTLNTKYLILASVYSGLAIATKVSSVIFVIVPAIVLISKIKYQRSKLSLNLKVLTFTFGFALCTLIFALLFSPHNFLNWREFVGSMRYESDVALGKYIVFYTRQFVNVIPVLFQMTKVFPYALGWPVFILGMLGVLGVEWRDKKVNLLRFAFLVYFLPNAFLFAKWTRFMVPIFPLMSIFAILFLLKLFDFLTNIKKFFTFNFLPVLLTFAFLLLTLITIFPGISYLSIYQKPDVRFQASEWIYKNIPENSYILSETANVVDIPIELESYKVHKVYKVISFNFYDLDENPQLQEELKEHLNKADYIFIPSRRIFANSPKEK
ncbi:MAG: glycosyltransferase family 39 protein, partial [Candidatus Roizmanbacteria bacterium]